MSHVRTSSAARPLLHPVQTGRTDKQSGVTQEQAGPKRTSRLGGVLHAITRLIEKHAPGSMRATPSAREALKSARREIEAASKSAEQGKQAALKSADGHLGDAIDALVSKQVGVAEMAGGKAAQALKTITDSTTGQPADIFKTCHELLVSRLHNLTPDKLEALHSGLDALQHASNPAIQQLNISVKSALLQSKMGVLDTEGKGSRGSRPAMDLLLTQDLIKIKDLHDLASQLLATTQSAQAPNTASPVTPYTQSDLKDIQGYGSTALGQLERIVARSATPTALKEMARAGLKDLKEAIDALIKSKGQDAVLTAGKLSDLQSTVADRIKDEDTKLTEKMLGKGPFKASALDPAQLARLAASIAPLTDKPTVLVDHEKAIQAAISEHKNKAEEAFKASLGNAIRSGGTAAAMSRLQFHVDQEDAARKMFNAMKEPLRTETVSSWIQTEVDRHLALGELGVAGLKSLQRSLTSGAGKAIQVNLSARDPASSGYLLELKEALDTALAADSKTKA